MRSLFLVLLPILIFTVTSFSQNNRIESAPPCTGCVYGEVINFIPTAIYNNVWRVDEMFINEVPVKDSIAYEVRFVFGEENNLLICYGISKANMFQWEYNISLKKIVFWNHDKTRKLDEFSIYSLDPFVLILKSNKKAPERGFFYH
jgi:hypothetical protein